MFVPLVKRNKNNVPYRQWYNRGEQRVPQPTDFRRELDGKVAIVTGGSQGLGEAIAREFAARGAAGLLLTGRNRERGQAVAASLTAAGCNARFHAADLADLDAVRRIVPAAEQAFGRLDILVNAAGDTDRGTILDTTPSSMPVSWRSTSPPPSS